METFCLPFAMRSTGVNVLTCGCNTLRAHFLAVKKIETWLPETEMTIIWLLLTQHL